MSLRAFSLIEIAVVVAIMGILAGIAVPTFLGQRNASHDRAAQSSLHTIVVAGRASIVSNFGNYPNGDNDLADIPEASDSFAGVLQTGEPTLVVNTLISTNDTEISVVRISQHQALYSAQSKSGTCWWVLDDLNRGTTFAADVDGDVTCRPLVTYGLEVAGTLEDATGTAIVFNNGLGSDFADFVELDNPNF